MSFISAADSSDLQATMSQSIKKQTNIRGDAAVPNTKIVQKEVKSPQLWGSRFENSFWRNQCPLKFHIDM